MSYPVDARNDGDLTTAKVIYALYAIGYFIPVTALAGVVFAYLARGRGEVLDSHLRFQIRTFWISILIGFVAIITLVIGIGFLIWGFLAIWGLVRVISGYLLANDGKPVSGSQAFGIIAI